LRVTRVKPVARPPGFVAIEVDGARLAVLPVEKARAFRLEVGSALDEALAREVERAGAAENSYRAAVRLLAVRDRSSQEILRRLRHKGLPPDAVAEAVGRLEVAGLLDDGRFAERFAHARAERGFGRTRILADLAARGVDRRVAERAVDRLEASGERDDAAEIDRLVRHRIGRMRGLPRPVVERRLVAFLVRRGFSGVEGLRAVRAVLRLDR
jgi:regulatory protein